MFCPVASRSGRSRAPSRPRGTCHMHLRSRPICCRTQPVRFSCPRCMCPADSSTRPARPPSTTARGLARRSSLHASPRLSCSSSPACLSTATSRPAGLSSSRTRACPRWSASPTSCWQPSFPGWSCSARSARGRASRCSRRGRSLGWQICCSSPYTSPPGAPRRRPPQPRRLPICRAWRARRAETLRGGLRPSSASSPRRGRRSSSSSSSRRGAPSATMRQGRCSRGTPSFGWWTWTSTGPPRRPT
mmetsp:Transcript_98192/g.305708  ORF Transcript_98192/g.305708 Transcript_98192/m.305708 type:complete len:246 (+) Transcript_98192:884-1621(+)